MFNRQILDGCWLASGESCLSEHSHVTGGACVCLDQGFLAVSQTWLLLGGCYSGYAHFSTMDSATKHE